MKVSDKLKLYFLLLAATAAISGISFVEYDKRHKGFLLASTVVFAVAFLAVSVQLLRWWGKVYKANG